MRSDCAREPRKTDMETPLSQFQRRQLEIIARVTPYSMAGHLLNATVLAVAVAGSIPTAQLVMWCVYSYASALVVLYRHMRNRGRVPRNFSRAARRATVYAVFLALPWSVMVVLYLGALERDQEMILVALGVGMAASGTIFLSAVPMAAFSYMSGALIPTAIKSLLFLNQQGYLLLGVLAVSYWWFLAALIAKISREIADASRSTLRSRKARFDCGDARGRSGGGVHMGCWNWPIPSQRKRFAKSRLGAPDGDPGAWQRLPRTRAS